MLQPQILDHIPLAASIREQHHICTSAENYVISLGLLLCQHNMYQGD